jgi:hypothetical protein
MINNNFDLEGGRDLLLMENNNGVYNFNTTTNNNNIEMNQHQIL